MGFQKSLRPCALDESSLSIGRVNSGIVGITFHQQLLLFIIEYHCGKFHALSDGPVQGIVGSHEGLSQDDGMA